MAQEHQYNSLHTPCLMLRISSSRSGWSDSATSRESNKLFQMSSKSLQPPWKQVLIGSPHHDRDGERKEYLFDISLEEKCPKYSFRMLRICLTAFRWKGKVEHKPPGTSQTYTSDFQQNREESLHTCTETTEKHHNMPTHLTAYSHLPQQTYTHQ